MVLTEASRPICSN